MQKANDDTNLSEDLAEKIRESKSSSQVIRTTLKTDDRVIARVTDGIYRQPASAIRELISNAYDADATRVVIKTDAPRFERISIEDNGHGMSPEVLAHMLEHIGSSAKRSSDGKDLGVTSKKDPFLSPNGRRLIGKIGIGIFSVSQLTQTFQIITKVKNDTHRTVATVILKQYTDDRPQEKNNKFESGKVNIWREKAADTKAHGTTIVLTDIRPQARDTLRSRDIWASIERSEQVKDLDETIKIEPPKFHIGRVDKSGFLLSRTANVPWNKGDKPDKAFSNLVNAVWDESEQSNVNPQLNRIFDYYLQMAWQLGLAIPTEYVEEHLFDINHSNWLETFLLSNKPKGGAEVIEFKRKASPREALDLTDGVNNDKFDVFFDNLKLKRPIKYKKLPTPFTHSLKKPIVFIGQCEEKFSSIPYELSGGPLKFEAYLFWYPKIVPTDHQGSLIRIHGASGTLFDPNFMRYQVAELTRLRQTTCEIFVKEGFDSALNIDRESFNFAHPHSVYLTKWLHGAMRQLATAQKRLASEVRAQNRDDDREDAFSAIQKIAADIWSKEKNDEGSTPPSIHIRSDDEVRVKGAGGYSFKRASIVPKKPNSQTNKSSAKNTILEEKLKAIAQVLASFDLLDNLTDEQQEDLFRAVYEILETSE